MQIAARELQQPVIIAKRRVIGRERQTLVVCLFCQFAMALHRQGDADRVVELRVVLAVLDQSRIVRRRIWPGRGSDRSRRDGKPPRDFALKFLGGLVSAGGADLILSGETHGA